MSDNQKLVLVTGCSKGIGFETCKKFLSKGFLVAGASRSETAINHNNFKHYSIDVSDSLSVNKMVEEIHKNFGRSIDILINNAGLGFSSVLHEMSDEKWLKMFDVNVHGLFYCTRAVLPKMIDKGHGHIVNISSIAGLTGVETMSGYCGTKHAVRGISHSLYKEVRNSGIKVTCIYPGSVNTNFFDEIDSVKANDNMMRAEDIANTIFECTETHPNYHVVDIELRPLKPKG